MANKLKPITNLNELSLGVKLQAIRKARGYTLKQLEEKSGVNAILISKYENDKVYPNITTLEYLCGALQVKASVLLNF